MILFIQNMNIQNISHSDNSFISLRHTFLDH